MNTGAAFYIGKLHKICEDYSCHGNTPEPYILLSDGCSSSPNTDFGSRILTKVAGDLLQKEPILDIDEMLIEADEIRRIINISQKSLDATLFCAYVRDTKYHLLMCGDGASVKIKDNGMMEIVLIEYPSGAPFYPNYRLDLVRKAGYKSEFGMKRKVTTYLLTPYGVVENYVESEDEDGFFYSEEGLCKDYKSISIMSDGIFSYYELLNTGTSKSGNPIDVNDVLRKLLDFKSFQGEFVDRRLQKFRKDCEKMNWFHADDISLATIFLGKE